MKPLVVGTCSGVEGDALLSEQRRGILITLFIVSGWQCECVDGNRHLQNECVASACVTFGLATGIISIVAFSFWDFQFGWIPMIAFAAFCVVDILLDALDIRFAIPFSMSCIRDRELALSPRELEWKAADNSVMSVTDDQLQHDEIANIFGQEVVERDSSANTIMPRYDDGEPSPVYSPHKKVPAQAAMELELGQFSPSIATFELDEEKRVLDNEVDAHFEDSVHTRWVHTELTMFEGSDGSNVTEP